MIPVHPHVVEVELARVEAAPADATHLGTRGEPGRVLLHDEAGVRRGITAPRIGPCQQGDAEGHVGAGVGDEGLAAVDEPPAVARDRPGRDAPRVGAGLGLGQAEGAEGSPLGQGSEPPLTLLVGAEEVQGQGSDGHVGLPCGGHRLVGQSDLLHGGDETDRGHADPTPPLRDEDPEQPERSHLPEQVGRTAGLLPSLRRPGGDLLLREFPTQADQFAFGLAEREVHRSDPIGPIGTGPGQPRSRRPPGRAARSPAPPSA